MHSKQINWNENKYSVIVSEVVNANAPLALGRVYIHTYIRGRGTCSSPRVSIWPLSLVDSGCSWQKQRIRSKREICGWILLQNDKHVLQKLQTQICVRRCAHTFPCRSPSVRSSVPPSSSSSQEQIWHEFSARTEIQYKFYILLVWPWPEILISVTLSGNKLTSPFNLVGTYFSVNNYTDDAGFAHVTRNNIMAGANKYRCPYLVS